MAHSQGKMLPYEEKNMNNRPGLHHPMALSFKRLEARGANSQRYQHTVGNYVRGIGQHFRTLFTKHGPGSFPILCPMDGLVKSGEMLLVLGKPGSGCSTFLKTISGDTNGFSLAQDSIINYDGTSV